jgi:hypothetical protein
MIIHYLRIALRYALRHKTYTLINVLGLSMGITCFCDRLSSCFLGNDILAEGLLIPDQSIPLDISIGCSKYGNHCYPGSNLPIYPGFLAENCGLFEI